MVVEIGLIIGCYVITRMFETLTKPADQRHVIVAISAVFTLGLTILLTISLLMRGAGSAS